MTVLNPTLHEGKHNPITLILLGDIAAGKGTQAKILVKKFGLKLVDTGAYSRKILTGKSKVNSRLGRVKLGKLAPSDIIQNYLKKEIASLGSNQGVLIDGGKMPAEARLVYKLLSQRKRKILVIYLSIPRKEIYRRLTYRFYDKKSGKPLIIDPNKVKAGRHKGRQVIKRADDDLAAVKNRIDYYDKVYSKTVKFWEGKGFLKEVSGQKSIEEVTKTIISIVKKRFVS